MTVGRVHDNINDVTDARVSGELFDGDKCVKKKKDRGKKSVDCIILRPILHYNNVKHFCPAY